MWVVLWDSYSSLLSCSDFLARAANCNTFYIHLALCWSVWFCVCVVCFFVFFFFLQPSVRLVCEGKGNKSGFFVKCKIFQIQSKSCFSLKWTLASPCVPRLSAIMLAHTRLCAGWRQPDRLGLTRLAVRSKSHNVALGCTQTSTHTWPLCFCLALADCSL